MKLLEEISRFLSNRLLSLSAFSGFVTGIYLFFNSPTFLGLLAVSLLFAAGFLILAYSLRSLYSGRSLKSITLFILSFLLVLGLFGGFVYINYQSVGGKTAYLKYNQISGNCERFEKWGGEKPAWYYSECKGMALERYCEKQAQNSYYPNFSSCIENPEPEVFSFS